MRKQKRKTVIPTRERAQPDALDWAPLFGAFQEAFEWALDVAAQLARDYPEEVAAVERVRAFMRKRFAGWPAQVRVDDVLFVFGLIIGAIERDLGPLDAVQPWFSPAMQLPSAEELWERTVPRHFIPVRRIGSPRFSIT